MARPSRPADRARVGALLAEVLLPPTDPEIEGLDAMLPDPFEDPDAARTAALRRRG